MTHWEKLTAMRKDLASLGLGANAGTPRLWRFLWFLRIKVPPLIFMRFWSVASIMSGIGILGLAFLLWLYFGVLAGIWLALQVSGAIVGGLAFGLAMARRCEHIESICKFPPWAEYTGQSK
jgi:hypothetical protein